MGGFVPITWREVVQEQPRPERGDDDGGGGAEALHDVVRALDQDGHDHPAVGLGRERNVGMNLRC